jgi:hypothetical protein
MSIHGPTLPWWQAPPCPTPHRTTEALGWALVVRWHGCIMPLTTWGPFIVPQWCGVGVCIVMNISNFTNIFGHWLGRTQVYHTFWKGWLVKGHRHWYSCRSNKYKPSTTTSWANGPMIVHVCYMPRWQGSKLVYYTFWKGWTTSAYGC